MDSGQILSWVMGVIGIFGFLLAGRKVWWAWYVNIACQALWITYAIVTNQPAFFMTALFYVGVFSRNAYLWTKEHRKYKNQYRNIAIKNFRVIGSESRKSYKQPRKV